MVQEVVFPSKCLVISDMERKLLLSAFSFPLVRWTALLSALPTDMMESVSKFYFDAAYREESPLAIRNWRLVCKTFYDMAPSDDDRPMWYMKTKKHKLDLACLEFEKIRFWYPKPFEERVRVLS